MSKICCFTGHRPHKLGVYDWHSPKNITIDNRLKIEIEKAMLRGTKSLYFGGALGTDQIC